MLVKVEELTGGPVARPPVPHVASPAPWRPGRPGPASRVHAATSRSTWRRRSRPPRPPTSRSSRPASRARTPTSSRASTGRPATCRCSSTSRTSTTRICCSSGCRRRTSSSTSSWGSSARSCPNGAANPAYDDVDLDGVKDGRVAAREGYIRSAYQEADEVLTLARVARSAGNPTTFVASDHGFAPQFLAIDASKPLVDLGLQLGAPQSRNCRITLPNPPPTDARITANFAKAKACWAGGALQIYLNVIGRDPDPRPSNARIEKLAERRPEPELHGRTRASRPTRSPRPSPRSRTRSSR